MTAKEKAKHLVNGFKGYAFSGFEPKKERNEDAVNHNAKKCALVCVDEILKEGATQYGATAVDYGREKYWYEVKSEIEKL